MTNRIIGIIGLASEAILTIFLVDQIIYRSEYWYEILVKFILTLLIVFFPSLYIIRNEFTETEKDKEIRKEIRQLKTSIKVEKLKKKLDEMKSRKYSESQHDQ